MELYTSAQGQEFRKTFVQSQISIRLAMIFCGFTPIACSKQETRMPWKGCMCKVIGRHADSTRGLSIGRYAMEARLVWNDPLEHEVDAFLAESRDHFFGPGEK